jgi:hypothetical protein
MKGKHYPAVVNVGYAMKKFDSPRQSLSLPFPLMGLKPSLMPEAGRVLPEVNKKERGELNSLVLDISKRHRLVVHAFLDSCRVNLACRDSRGYCG